MSKTQESKTLWALLAWLVTFILASAIALTFFSNRSQNHTTQFLGYVSQLGIVAQQLAHESVAASKDDVEKFNQLEQSLLEFRAILSRLQSQSASVAEKKSASDILNQSELLQQTVTQLLAKKEALPSLNELLDFANAQVPKIKKKLTNILSILEQDTDNPQPENVRSILQQLSLLERMRGNLAMSVKHGQPSGVAVQAFEDDTVEFGNVLDALVFDNTDLEISKILNEEARSEIKPLLNDFIAFQDYAKNIFSLVPGVNSMRDLVLQIEEHASAVSKFSTDSITSNLSAQGQVEFAGFKIGTWVMYALLGTALVLGLILALFPPKVVLHTEPTSRNRQQEREALMQHPRLSDTDTYSESQNVPGYKLLGISQSSHKLTEAVQQVGTSTAQLSDESSQHVERLVSAINQLDDIKETADTISTHALDSADVSKKFMQSVMEGSMLMLPAISALHEIKDQLIGIGRQLVNIREQAGKIDNVIENNNHLADETSLILLNAAIQGGSSGKGRSLSTSIERLQQLTDQVKTSSSNLKALKSNIQKESSSILSVMEESTLALVDNLKDVKEGSTCLKELEEISNYLADLNRRIAQTAERQTVSSTEIGDAMKSLRIAYDKNQNRVSQLGQKVEQLESLTSEIDKIVKDTGDTGLQLESI